VAAVTWFRVDDSFPQHPKVLAIPRRDRAAAVGLWTLAGTWCAAQLTDGRLGTHMVEELAGTKRSAELLVTVGLWETTDDGYQIHDYLDYNPTAEEVRADQAAKHEAKVKAGRLGGIASGVARRKHSGSRDEAEAKQDASTGEANGKQNEAPTRPDPSLTASSNEEAGPRKRARRIPDDFQPDDKLREFARKRGFSDPQIDEVTAQFVRYWQAKGGKDASKLDWPKTWQNWITREDPARVRVLHAAADTNQRLTSDEIIGILGYDSWQLPPTPPGMSEAEAFQWELAERRKHIEDRQQQARERAAMRA
jgi:hypothetical protein